AAAARTPAVPAVTRATADGTAISRARDAPWITATPGTMCQQMTIRACQAAGFTPRTRHQVDDFATTLSLVAAGPGPRPGAPPPRGPRPRRPRIAYRRGAGAHPAVAAVTAALREAVPPELRAAE